MEEKYIKILGQKLKPAIGCTEPIAIALAGAVAMNASQGLQIQGIKVKASGNIIKNAMAVIIPGTKDSGIDLAVALGVLCYKDSSRQLEVLETVDKEKILKAKKLIDDGLIQLELAETDKKLYIEVEVVTDQDKAKAIIEDEHTNITLIEVDGKTKFCKGNEECSGINEEGSTSFLTLDGIMDFVDSVEIKKLGIIKDSIRLNKAISEEGIKGEYGLQTGKTTKIKIDSGILGDDIINHAIAKTSAGSDARMAGAMMPVMSNSGSGNQGITATLPVVSVGEKLCSSEEEIIRATALSNLISIYIKARFGVLSALCGATVAATGASCGVVYLLGGDKLAVRRTIKNMLGNISGMLCDGAKPGCAFKVATCTGTAVKSAIIAIDGREIGGNEGIVGDTAEKTIENFCRISREASADIDKIILDIMVGKQG